MNFLYCFDENYNYQAFSSIISLLDVVNEKIAIYIIHNNQNLMENLPTKIKQHINLSEIKIYKFNEKNYFFPNIPKTHVSEATYYRLFIHNYLPSNINQIVYLDADVICLKNPINFLKKEFKKLINTENLISARTEINKKEIEKIYLNEWEMPWNRLEVDEKYFNAGVMLINYKKWISRNYTDKFIDFLVKGKSKIIMWDQDVMNSVINGNYNELSLNFNFKDEDLIKLNKTNNNKFEEIIFYHYAGSGKPWKPNGAFRESAKFYHINYRKIQNQKYHIEHNNIINSFKNIINSIRNGSFSYLEYRFTYLFEFIKTILIKLVKSI